MEKVFVSLNLSEILDNSKHRPCTPNSPINFQHTLQKYLLVDTACKNHLVNKCKCRKTTISDVSYSWGFHINK